MLMHFGICTFGGCDANSFRILFLWVFYANTFGCCNLPVADADAFQTQREFIQHK